MLPCVLVFPQVPWTTWWWPICRAEACSCSYLMLLCFDWIYIYIDVYTICFVLLPYTTGMTHLKAQAVTLPWKSIRSDSGTSVTSDNRRWKNQNRPQSKRIFRYYMSVTCRYEPEGLGIESRWGRDSPQLSRLALGPIQSPVKWVPSMFPGGKMAGAWCWLPPPIQRWSQRKSRGILLLSLWVLKACCLGWGLPFISMTRGVWVSVVVQALQS
jgi:hypothetical protein